MTPPTRLKHHHPTPSRLSRSGAAPPGLEGAGGSFQPRCHITAGFPSTRGHLNFEDTPPTHHPPTHPPPPPPLLLDRRLSPGGRR